MNIVVLISGNGSNLQAIIDACADGRIQGQVKAVVSSNPTAYGLERATQAGIPSYWISRKQKTYEQELLDCFAQMQPDLIVLAGYLGILSRELVQAYQGKIINIHPSLIPKYCGKGYYGIKVHQAVIAGREKESGATVHFVDQGIDTGQIIIQRAIPVLAKDSPQTLADRVLAVEHQILIEAIQAIEKQLCLPE